MAAQMAALPKPCVIRLKWVKQPWMPGSKMGLGLVFPSGVLSWVRRSVNSLQICLQDTKWSHFTPWWEFMRKQINKNREGPYQIFGSYAGIKSFQKFITTSAAVSKIKAYFLY